MGGLCPANQPRPHPGPWSFIRCLKLNRKLRGLSNAPCGDKGSLVKLDLLRESLRLLMTKQALQSEVFSTCGALEIRMPSVSTRFKLNDGGKKGL